MLCAVVCATVCAQWYAHTHTHTWAVLTSECRFTGFRFRYFVRLFRFSILCVFRGFSLDDVWRTRDSFSGINLTQIRPIYWPGWELVALAVLSLSGTMHESYKSHYYTPWYDPVDYLWSPYGIGQTIIFSSCRLFLFFFFLSSFFPRLISAVAEWMSAILAHTVWP